MSVDSRDINDLLGAVGWGTETLCARLGGVNHRTVERWRAAPETCPGVVVDWLARLASAQEIWNLPVGWEIVQ